MAAEVNVSENRPHSGEPLGVAPAPSGYARVARRIATWTTNGILSALILVTGLAFGRQVLDWWASDAEVSGSMPPQVVMTEGLGDSTRPHRLEFGEAAWVMLRHTAVGGRDEAAAALRAICLEATASGALPDDAIGAAEAEFLASVVGHAPVAEEPGAWQLHELDAGIPLAVGVRLGENVGENETGTADAPRGASQSRVAAWGLALPSDAETWTLYTFSPRQGAGARGGARGEVALPPETVPTLAMHAEGGGGLVGFRADLQPEACRPCFDRHFEATGWQPAGPWRKHGTSWHRRYAPPGEAARSVLVELGPGARSGATGLMLMTPSEDALTEGERL
jgi:hypothetical protein